MKFFLSVGLFLSFAFSSFAQKNLKPALIVLNNQDTVRGRIDVKNWSTTPNSIDFYDINGVQKKYTVSELVYFAIEGLEQYKRFLVSYQLAAADMSNATNDYVAGDSKDNLWLKVLYKGKYSLYEWISSKRTYFFVGEGEQIPVELLYRIKLVNGDIIKDEAFKNQLTNIAANAGSKAIFDEINSADYNENDLVKVFKILNNNTGTVALHDDKVVLKEVSFAVGINGFKNSNSQYFILSTTSGFQSRILMTNFNTTIGFKADYGLTFTSKQRIRKITPRLGFGLRMMQYNASYQETGVDEQYKGTAFLAHTNISANFLLKQAGNSKWHLSPVLSYNFCLNKSAITYTYKNSIQSGSLSNYPSLSDFLSLGLGLHYTSTFGKLFLQYEIIGAVTNTNKDLSAKAVHLGYVFLLPKKVK